MKVFVIGGSTGDQEDEGERTRLLDACGRIGASIAEGGHELVVCSPFNGSADAAVLVGAAPELKNRSTRVEFNFVDSHEVRSQLEILGRELGLSFIKVPHPAPPQDAGSMELRYAWLLCQLRALDSCHIVIAIGGKRAGSANMLLQLADSKRKPVIPIPFLGGAAEEAFERRRYELADKLGAQLSRLQSDEALYEIGKIAEIVASTAFTQRRQCSSREPHFFISYARARASEADFVETVLRRRNHHVFRDESDFGAGHAIPGEIREAIHRSEVFIAIWCNEYACSPWCYDELNLALDRHEAGALELWIFCVDGTRIVPPRARNLVNYPIASRQELAGNILELLGRFRPQLV